MLPRTTSCKLSLERARKICRKSFICGSLFVSLCLFASRRRLVQQTVDSRLVLLTTLSLDDIRAGRRHPRDRVVGIVVLRVSFYAALESSPRLVVIVRCASALVRVRTTTTAWLPIRICLMLLSSHNYFAFVFINFNSITASAPSLHQRNWLLRPSLPRK